MKKRCCCEPVEPESGAYIAVRDCPIHGWQVDAAKNMEAWIASMEETEAKVKK